MRGKIYSRKYTMRTVEKMHHWHCNQREYDSTTSSNKHNKTQSGKRKNYNIAIIAIITTQSGHLNRDKKTHLGCKICEYSCITNGDLKRHMMGMHTKKKPYKCDLCSYSTAISHNLQVHMRTHTTQIFDQIK